jgi:hypothetical protein
MMRKFYAFSIFLALISFVSVKAQNINNGGFENWENLGSATEEPNDWNSFKTASGTLSSFGVQQIKRSADVRAGASGTYSAVIWSREAFTIIANGNMTTGQVNMGNVDPANANNYNITHTADANFNEAFTDLPDSLVFWTKFKPANAGGTDSARMRAVYHDTYDYRDPTASDVNAPNHVFASATLHFATTSSQWVRKAVPFNYTGPAASGSHILITFTTNKNAGGGSDGDSLFIDDLEMIYNGIGIIEPNMTNQFSVFADQATNQLVVKLNFDNLSNTTICIYSINGQLIKKSEKEIQQSTEHFDLNIIDKGIYIVEVTRADGSRFTQKFAKR